MNEQIKAIAVQAKLEHCVSHVRLQEFAELIVRECMNKVRSRQRFAIQDDDNADHAFDLLVYDLESYFGVEE